MKALGYIFATLIVGFIGTIYGGWVFAKLWAWFIASTFDVQSLTMGQSIGIMCIWGSLKARVPKKDPRPFGEQLLDVFLFSLTHWTFTLLIGALIHTAIK